MPQSGIYAITNIVNGHQYIGSSLNIPNRWRVHRSELRRNIHHSDYLQHAWNKYGEENFTFEMIEEVLPTERILREQYWIDLLQPVYNASPTAALVRLSDATRAKLSALAIGRPSAFKGKHHSKEAKAKISKVHKGKVGPNKGKPMSMASRAKVSASKTGVPYAKPRPKRAPFPYKPRPAQSERQRGVKHSLERVEKNRASHLGKTSPMKGKSHSEEARTNMRLAAQKREETKRAKRTMQEAPLWDTSEGMS